MDDRLDTDLLVSSATLYTSCILVGIFINSSIPIFFELFIETVYPVPEGITCGVVTFLSNLFTGLLLFVLTFYFTGKLYSHKVGLTPKVSSHWMFQRTSNKCFFCLSRSQIVSVLTMSFHLLYDFLTALLH